MLLGMMEQDPKSRLEHWALIRHSAVSWIERRVQSRTAGALQKMAAHKEANMLLSLAGDYTYNAPSIWDWLTLASLETACAVF